ncbi:LacI family DNA-binding transcriptional regulator [Silvibacterium dinghuense]|uniref:LacI family transcriptional regulator n=1 Tax=Silvibacterium dinghuense TaxID=1560006 RepID=A0A4Q1SBL5_9BACT|nr:LacI family DNA-binding transcriptional regulator [Silvibacterium dinghuense]RXS94528.1 LacI family transcriptional regulator [Silvibacterium dinghuense]
MAVRMKDIARDLGLSVVTVSKVLRDHPDIAEETKERVMKRVRELDYQPNVLARSLVTGRSYLIGLIVPDLLHPFFAEIAKALSSAVRAQGYSIILSSSEEDPSLEAREIQQLLARRLDALVIASAAENATSFERLERAEQPYLLIDREFPELAANFVGIDDIAAGRLATEHLIQQGCRNIAHICGGNHSTGVRRYEGYRQALRAARLPFSESLVTGHIHVDTESIRHGAEAARYLLAQRTRPDGIFCFNDPLAIGAMNAILDAGLRIPEDIALIGCGNLHYDASLRVPLSSIDQRSTMIGERAAAILLNMFSSKKRPQPVSVILNPELVVRASSLRKPARQSGTRASAPCKSSRRH